MRLIVNDIAATEGGALSILKDFYRFVRDNEETKKIEWLFIVSDDLLEETSNIKIHMFKKKRFNWIRRFLFDNYIINRLSKEFHADGIISLQNTISFTSGLPQLVYMHQVIPFQKEKKFSFLKKNEYKYAIYQFIIGSLIKKSLKKANLVVVQAKWLKDLVASQAICCTDSIIVNSLDCESCNYISEPKNSNYETNFFYPAFECVYKNQDIIRKACSLLEARGIKAKVELTINSNNTQSNIIRTCGKLTHEEVMQKLSNSTLIFPSYVETIGLPLIEAMSVNTLVLAADCQYAHETLKGYPNAYFFNPFNHEELADLMIKVITGDIKRIDYHYQTSNHSDWGNVVSSFVNIIESKRLKAESL